MTRCRTAPVHPHATTPRRASWFAVGLVALLPLCATLLPRDAAAQVTTGGVRGLVKNEAGVPVANAKVKLTNAGNGSSAETTSNETGAYAFSGVQVGGPYVLAVLADTYAPYSSDPLFVSVGKFVQRDVPLRLTASVQEVEIVGTAMTRKVSPGATFDAKQVVAAPSISRDPKDLVKLSPDVYVNTANSGALSIGGANNRFNSLTVDGIRQDDDFGLNANGYPTLRSPVSLSAIQQISVEQSPFDVRYGRFVGGNINVITKSGGNDFHASLFGNFASGALAGNEWRSGSGSLNFREMQGGMTLSGPMIEDTLHFFVSAEGFGGTIPISFGPRGSGAASEVTGVTAGEVAKAQQVARDVYGFDAGVVSKGLSESDYKLLAKLDWTINEEHRLTTTFQRTSGNSINAFKPNLNTSDLYLTSYWYNNQQTLYTTAVKLFSSWTPELNTELEISGKLTSTQKDPLSGRDFMDARIATHLDGDEKGPVSGHLYLGPEKSEHANELSNNLWHAKAGGDYLMGEHLVSGGLEVEQLHVFNLYVPSSNGSAEYDTLTAFEGMRPTRITYQNAVTNNARDGAANWSYAMFTAYAQDEVELTPELSAQAGLRLEAYQASDNIKLNQNFVDKYGYANTATLSGRSVVLPRVGVTYSPIDALNLRAGFGLYSGAAPIVWVSNNYTNDGVTVVSADPTLSKDAAAVNGFDGRNVPAALQNSLVPGNGNVNALDPKFKIPSTWKSSIGLDYGFALPLLGRGFDLSLNYTYSIVRHAVMWKDLRRDLPSNKALGTLPDGRSYYDPNSTTNPITARGTDLVLTNATRGFGHVLSAGLRRKFDFGLQLYGGYAYQNVKEISPGSSSVAASNYKYMAVFDPNNPQLATSNYERKHRLVGVAEVSRTIVGELLSSISLVFELRSGQPYSYTFGGADDDLARLFGEDRSVAGAKRMLFYVPKGDGSDVILDNGLTEEQLNAYLHKHGLDAYRGQVAPRNAFQSPWVNRVDMRIAQELAHPAPGHLVRLVIDIQNLGNLMQPRWGQYEEVGFPYMVPAVDVAYDETSHKYRYSNLNTKPETTVDTLMSVWRLQAGLVYEM